MTDTSAEAEKVRIAIFRAMSPARKLSIAFGWSSALRGMIRAKLKQEHGNATEAQLQRMLAERWLGPELALKVYGPMEKHG